MSGGNDNPFARWSRRKRAARSEETYASPETEQAQEDPAAPVDADASPQRPEPSRQEPQTGGPTEPLPRLEDLTAESDLTAFLKKGVPLALKSAAMRKMWSLDPGIRDYIGPSEYAWDFNKPGSMAGFGPLDPGKSVVSFLSRTVQALGEDAQQTASIRAADAPSDEAADIETDAPATAETPSVVPPAQQPAVRVPVIPAGSGRDASAEARSQPETAAVPAPDSERSSAPEPLPRPRHGGAMPR